MNDEFEEAQEAKELEHYSDAQLEAMAQGCTEFSCLYHGMFNRERKRREREAKQ